MWMEASSLKCISPIFESKVLKASAAEPGWCGLQLNRTRWQLWMGQFTASFQCPDTDNSLKKKIIIWTDLFLAEPSFPWITFLFDPITKIRIAIFSCIRRFSALVSMKMRSAEVFLASVSYFYSFFFSFFFFECAYFWRFIHSGTRVAKWVHQRQSGRGSTAWEAGRWVCGEWGAGQPQKSGKCALGLRVCRGTEAGERDGGRMHKSCLNRAHNCC